MEEKKYWWHRYGAFDPGNGDYPHFGQVIAYYRLKRGFAKQEALAVATGHSKRWVEEIENSSNIGGPDSIEKRKLLAKVLRIPPALIGLDWHFMAGNDELMPAQLEESMYNLYNNVLQLGVGYLYSGGPAYIGKILRGNLENLEPTVKNISGGLFHVQKEEWLTLLCKYYMLCTSFSLRATQYKTAFVLAKKAIIAAEEAENNDLLAAAYYRRARLYLDVKEVARSEQQKKKYIELARSDAMQALDKSATAHPALLGNIYLMAAETCSYTQERRQCKKWYDAAYNIIAKERKAELYDSDTFIRFNQTALHHEKAKTLKLHNELQAALDEVSFARSTLQPDIVLWQANLNLTEARIYKDQRELEASVKLAADAFRIACLVNSDKDQKEVREHFFALQEIDDSNPYVCNLGLQIGAL